MVQLTLMVSLYLSSVGLSRAGLPHNQVAGLVPPSGGWRGATGQGGSPDGYQVKYKKPVHIWRVFSPTLTAKVTHFIKKEGGIAFVCSEPQNWTKFSGVDADVNAEIGSWAKEYAALKPAKLLFSPRHEPDGHVDAVSNTPAAYRAMWANMRNIFDSNGADNVLMLMDYSGKIRNKTKNLIKPLWPGDHLVDWLFFNVFNFVGAGNYIRAVEQSYDNLLELDGPGYSFKSKPWGLGAFGATIDTKHPETNRPKWLNDAKSGIDNYLFPKLKAYVYFDSLSSQISDYMVPAYKSFISDQFFTSNDDALVVV